MRRRRPTGASATTAPEPRTAIRNPLLDPESASPIGSGRSAGSAHPGRSRRIASATQTGIASPQRIPSALGSVAPPDRRPVSFQNGRAFALDALTGKAIWRTERRLPADLKACCGKVNRGFAIQGNKLFMATLDAHLKYLRANA